MKQIAKFTEAQKKNKNTKTQRQRAINTYSEQAVDSQTGSEGLHWASNTGP